MIERSNETKGGIAYLNTQYPALSHTFIEREVTAVRACGLPIQTISIRSPRPCDVLGAAHREAYEQTIYISSGIGRIAMAQLKALITRPFRYLKTMARAQKISPPGAKARFRHLAYTLQSARLVQEMKRVGLRHVHVHMANNGAAVALLACTMDPKLSYSLSIHGSAEFFHIEDWTLRAKVEDAVFVRCISDFCKSQVMTWTSPSKWNCYHVVHCGIDPAKFLPRQKNSSDRLRIVTVGRLTAIKGYFVLLDACARLNDAGVEWELKMVGDGPDRQQLEKYAAKLGLQDRVSFRGPVSQEDMPTELDGADVMVISSFMEGIPVVLMEAMAKELAVVSTAVGGIPELITEGVTGLLVPPASEEKLAEALQHLATHRDLVQQLGTSARQKILDEFSIGDVGQKMHKHFASYGCLQLLRHHQISI